MAHSETYICFIGFLVCLIPILFIMGLSIGSIEQQKLQEEQMKKMNVTLANKEADISLLKIQLELLANRECYPAPPELCSECTAMKQRPPLLTEFAESIEQSLTILVGCFLESLLAVVRMFDAFALLLARIVTSLFQ